MPVAFTCQMYRDDPTERPCEYTSKGFVIRKDESPLAVYKTGLALCERHGAALQDELPESQFVMTAELRDMMTEEERARNQRMHTTPEPTSMARAFAQAQAAQDDEEAEGEAPAENDDGEEEEAAPAPAPTKAPVLCAQAKALLKEAALFRKQASDLRLSAAKLAFAGRASLMEAAAQLEQQASDGETHAQRIQAAYEAHATRTRYQTKILHGRGPEWDTLQQALYRGGMEAIQAMEGAIASGFVTLRAPKGKAAKGASRAPQSATPRPGSAEQEALKTRVRELCAQGYTQGQIGEMVGKTRAAVSNMLQRMGINQRHPVAA